MDELYIDSFEVKDGIFYLIQLKHYTEITYQELLGESQEKEGKLNLLLKIQQKQE